MTEHFCDAKNEMCNPTGCNVEMCRWRDTVWALANLSKWAYGPINLESKPVPQNNLNENNNANKPR